MDMKVPLRGKYSRQSTVQSLMEPADQEPQEQAQQRRDQLDYRLWHVIQVATDARRQLAENQAELENLRTLCDTKSDSLVQSWVEYQGLSDALQAEVCKTQQLSKILAQVTHNLDDETSRRQTVERSFDKYKKQLGEERATAEEDKPSETKLGKRPRKRSKTN